jgi:D-sedoheptulose 7-phosphate isomerase
MCCATRCRNSAAKPHEGAALNLTEFFKSEFAEHHDVARRTEAGLSAAFAGLVGACVKSVRGGGKLMFFGNGGSAGDAQHLATELTIRYKADRAAIAAIALTTDTSALTAAGNDLGFDKVFARQIEALGRPGDVAIAISTSGKSPNIIAALRQAKAMNLTTAALGGKGGGDMAGLADHLLVVPSATTARIQEMHIALGQMLCGALEIELGLAKPDR